MPPGPTTSACRCPRSRTADARRHTPFTPARGRAAVLPGTRVELHFHLLPGVDDGPRTIDEALALARLAVADGTRLVVCTPHVHLVDVATLPERVHELAAALHEAEIPLDVEAGGEILPGTGLTDAELEILAQGPPGRRWVLLEAPLDPAAGLDVFRADVEELQARGYGLLIGHPERCPPLMAAGGGLDDLLGRGAKLQVNASSMIGDHGDASRRAGFDLLAGGLVDVLASDAHGTHRPPCLSAALDALAARGIDAAALAAERPRQLVEHGISVRERPSAPGAGAAPGRVRAGRRR